MPTCCKIFKLGIMLWSAAAGAITFNLKNQASNEISIKVGTGSTKVSEVAFSIPASQLGNGTTITGSPTIKIKVEIRATGTNPLTAFLTVDSFTNPLQIIDPGSTNSIPFSQISWTSRNGDIPSGTFAGTIDQPLVDFPSSQRKLDDFHTFIYANTLSLEAGTYTGQVTYTFALP